MEVINHGCGAMWGCLTHKNARCIKGQTSREFLIYELTTGRTERADRVSARWARKQLPAICHQPLVKVN